MRRRTHLRNTLVSWAVLALALAPAGPALAAGVGTTTTGSIVITRPISHSAYAYQVFDGDVEADGSVADIRWGSGVNDDTLMDELTALTEFSSCTSAREVAELLKVDTGGTETELAKLFAEAVSHNLRAEGAVAFEGTDTPTASALDDGWYVVASDYDTDLAEGASLLFPGLITVGAGQSNVTPKESAPTLVKEVQEDSTGTWQSHADFEIGQSFQQRLVATIGDADLSYYHSYYLGFSDTLSAGLDLDPKSVTVTIDGEDKTDLFTIDYENRKLSVVAQDILKEIEADSEVTVTYTTKLNKHADSGTPGNENSATLTYSADPRAVQEGEPELKNTTPDDKTVSYTYALKITKTDADNGEQLLAGAKFSLRRSSDNKYAVLVGADGGSIDTATNNNEGNGSVFVTGWTDAPKESGFVTTDADGCAHIVGLDAADAYVLNEAVAPDGYDLDTSDIPFVISADPSTDKELSVLSVSVSGGEATEGIISEGRVSVGVSDVKAPILPTTGLGGIVASVVLGSGLVAVAATVIARQASHGNRE